MQRDLNALAGREFDILVIGGGIHGAWAAWRGVQAGYRVALLEQGDFAAGTSANSLKILHGGLRYLQHLDFARMRSSIRARREFARFCPHLFEPLPCVMPLRAGGMRSPWVLGPALFANDVISIDRNVDVEERARLPRGSLLRRATCVNELLPLTDAQPFAGARWWDALALDTARLTLEPLIAASTGGAVLANHVRVDSYLLRAGRVVGVTAADALSGRSFEVNAAVVINATGPGAADLSRAAGLAVGHLPRAWIGGLNVVLRRPLGLRSAVALSTAAADGTIRELFFVPWRGVTLIGTDYVPLNSPAEAAAGPPAGAAEAFIRMAAQIAPNAQLSSADIASVHWGALPVSAAGSRFPSKRPFLASGTRECGAEGLVVAVGEKLTSAPVVSQLILRRAVNQLPQVAGGPTRTARPPLTDGRPIEAGSAGISPDIVARLRARYGHRWPQVARPGLAEPSLLQPVQASAPVLGVEIVHAAREEMAVTLDDVLIRRVGLGEKGTPGRDLSIACANVLIRHCDWDDEVLSHPLCNPRATRSDGSFDA